MGSWRPGRPVRRPILIQARQIGTEGPKKWRVPKVAGPCPGRASALLVAFPVAGIGGFSRKYSHLRVRHPNARHRDREAVRYRPLWSAHAGRRQRLGARLGAPSPRPVPCPRRTSQNLALQAAPSICSVRPRGEKRAMRRRPRATSANRGRRRLIQLLPPARPVAGG